MDDHNHPDKNIGNGLMNRDGIDSIYFSDDMERAGHRHFKRPQDHLDLIRSPKILGIKAKTLDRKVKNPFGYKIASSLKSPEYKCTRVWKNDTWNGKTVGFGSSMTLYERRMVRKKGVVLMDCRDVVVWCFVANTLKLVCH